MSEIEILSVSETEKETLHKLYSTFRDQGQSYIKTSPGNCVLPAAYEKFKDRIHNLQLRSDDVFVLTWVKNGTTWTQEMVWCLQNNCDFQTAKRINTLERVPFLESSSIFDFLSKNMPPNFPSVASVSLVEEMKSPRVVKSHLPYCLLPGKILDECKVVTCIRNPKDTLVSMFHHEKLLNFVNFGGDFAEFFDLFMNNLVIFSPYWEYTLEAWNRRDHPNLCLLFFEDLKKDLEGNVRKVAKFLQKDLTDSKVVELAEHLSFKNMKKMATPYEDERRAIVFNKADDKSASFYRKGVAGDWRNYFTEEMSKRMDERIEQYFGGTGLEFKYD